MTSKQDRQATGILAGILPAIWAGAYLLHLFPVHNLSAWWAMPYILTITTASITIPVITGFLFGKYAEWVARHIIERNNS